jgi:hypothetical protein
VPDARRHTRWPSPRAADARLTLPDGTLALAHRYETWVDYVSRPLSPRVDLTPLARRLQGLEERPGRWLFEGVQVIMPRLFLSAGPGGPAPSPSGRAPAGELAFRATRRVSDSPGSTCSPRGP